MKTHYPFRAFLCKALLFITFLFYNVSNAQSGIGIAFDNEVGCQVYSEDVIKRLFLSDIADGFCLRMCAGSTVNYELYGDSLANINTVEWIVSGGTLMADNTVTATVQWDGIGFGTLQLNIIFNDGTSHTKMICVEKIISPKSNFDVIPFIGADEITVCEDQPITFTQSALDNGGTDIVSYYWIFEGPNNFLETSAAENPTITFPAYGDYKATLIVTNECSCKGERTITVHVIRPGIIISCPSVACEKQTSTYSVDPSQLNGCTSFDWHVDGGTIMNYSPDHTQIDVVWDNVGPSGFGYVSFDATQCPISCPTIVTVMIPVVQIVGTIVGEAIICEKGQYRYKLPQWPATEFNWTLAPGSTASTLIHTDQWNEVIIDVGAPGNITLSCAYTNTLLGCGGTATLLIKILSSVTIDGPSTACEGNNIQYTLLNAIGNPVSGDWSLEGPGTTQTGTGTTFNAAFTEVGTYVFNISGLNLCTPQVFTVTVVPRPFTPAGIIGDLLVCPNAPINYTVQNAQPGFVYTWNVAGGDIQGASVAESISVIFQPGQPFYVVTVRALQEDEPHCSSHPASITVNVINPDVTINSTFTQVCASSYGTYATTYAAGDSYNWTIIPPDAGSVSTGQGTPTVTILWNNYTGGTPPEVKLEVFECGLPYSDTFPVTIILSPQITLTTPNQTVCQGEDFVVTLIGTPALTEIDHMVLNYGDGTPPITITPDAFGNFPTTATIQYNTPNPSTVFYDITIMVYGPNGCLTPAQATLQMTVLPAPVADISPAVSLVVCDPSAINITFTANVQAAFGFGIQWFNGSAPVGIINSLTYAPTGFGNYYAVVTNTNGCSAETNHTYVIQNCNPATCSITPDLGEIQTDLTACLTGSASITVGSSPAPTSYQWSSSGGGTVSGTPTQTTCDFSFSEPGEYIIFYTATYIVGTETCIFVKTQSLIVPYQADLKYEITCNNNGTYDVELINHSIVFGGSSAITNYQFLVNGSWINNFGSPNYTATLPAGTTQPVGIKITGPDSPFPCIKTLSIPLPALPNADFTVVASTCPGEPIVFTPAVMDPDFTYTWTFDDGSNNSVPQPSKVYQTGQYYPFLTVTNSLNCSSTSAPQQVDVFLLDMQGSVGMTPSGSSCANNPVTLTHIPTNPLFTPPYTYNWMVGTTIVPDNSNASSYTPAASGIYWLSIIDGHNCKLDLPAGNVVNYIAAPEAVIEGPTSVCKGDTITLDGYTGGNSITYSWSDGASVVGTDPTLTIIPLVDVTYTLTVSTPNGAGVCSNSALHTVDVLETPPVPIISIVAVNCDIYGVKLHADTGVPGFYSWSNGASGQDILVFNGGPYQVRFTNLAGCTSVSQIDIPKAPSAYFWIFPRGCYSACQDDLGSVIGPIEPVKQWQWLIDSNIVDAGINSTVNQLPVTVSGEYQLTLNTGLCQQTSELMSITSELCEDCHLQFTKQDIKAYKDEEGNCYYVLSFDITSTFSAPATFSSSIGGTFIPSGFNLLVGNNSYPYVTTYYPPAGFNGGTIFITIQSMIDGKVCITKKELNFGPCQESGRYQMEITDAVASNAYLQIAPNPGDAMTNIFFNFGKVGAGNKTMEVVDMLGRLISRKDVKEVTGSIELDISGFVAGYYLILMKSDGKLVKQNKLLKK